MIGGVKGLPDLYVPMMSEDVSLYTKTVARSERLERLRCVRVILVLAKHGSISVFAPRPYAASPQS